MNEVNMFDMNVAPVPAPPIDTPCNKLGTTDWPKEKASLVNFCNVQFANINSAAFASIVVSILDCWSCIERRPACCSLVWLIRLIRPGTTCAQKQASEKSTCWATGLASRGSTRPGIYAHMNTFQNAMLNHICTDGFNHSPLSIMAVAETWFWRRLHLTKLNLHFQRFCLWSSSEFLRAADWDLQGLYLMGPAFQHYCRL